MNHLMKNHVTITDPFTNPFTNSADPLLVSSYDYSLPEHLIARYPLQQRTDSRLLYLPYDSHPQARQPEDKQFTDLPDLLNAGDLVVFNDTKVMKARLYGCKETGGKVEVLVERLTSDPKFTQGQQNVALCHVRASKSPKIGQSLYLANKAIVCTVLGRHENLFVLAFAKDILTSLEAYGELPIPPYFSREATETDDERYQTVFHNPNKLASVAAPTASLHFDKHILKRLTEKGINTAFVTLNVGAGTFAPVKTDNILAHKMHSEYAHLSQKTAELIQQTKAKGGQVIAVGTTVTRVLETAYQQASQHSDTNVAIMAWSGETDIFIYPGFKFGVVDRLLTNFHLPKSTLLMLVSAFAGKSAIAQAYQHAIKHSYRFFSYGDAMLLDKGE